MSTELRQPILNAWDRVFWLIVDRDHAPWAYHATDVHTAIEKWLTHLAVNEPELISPLVGVSIEGSDGPWTTFPVGPAYRQAPESTRVVVRRVLSQSHPMTHDEWLTSGDVESYEAWSAEMQAAR